MNCSSTNTACESCCGDEGDSCCETPQETRRFFTKAERIAMLKEYKKQLDLEAQGVAERISSLENSEDN